MKTLVGIVIFTLTVTGCAAAQTAPEPTASQSQNSSATPSDDGETEPSAGEAGSPSPTPTSASAKPSTPGTSTAPTAPTSPTPITTSTPSSSVPPATGFTMAEVRVNNTTASCWVVIDSRVYNLTAWISNHPGGAGAISGLCGTDGTASFTAQHGGDSTPARELSMYEIGPLR